MLRTDAEQKTIDAFHKLYYYARLWEHTWWMGVPISKCPLDLWIYQEIIFNTRPDIVIECGTAHGGSALFLATLLDLLGNGRVITIDVNVNANLPKHDRILYIHGSSVEEATIAQVRSQIAETDKVMVVLDSLHNRDHVLKELEFYQGFVTVGCYLIVEDSNINGHPVFTDCERDSGPGPFEAVEAFLNWNNDFTRDEHCEKLLMTFNPGGYLRRLAASGKHDVQQIAVPMPKDTNGFATHDPLS